MYCYNVKLNAQCERQKAPTAKVCEQVHQPAVHGRQSCQRAKGPNPQRLPKRFGPDLQLRYHVRQQPFLEPNATRSH